MKDQVPRLPSQAESLLSSWPIPERAEDAWEEVANGIVVKLESVKIGSTDDALLGAPLPAQADEGAAAPASAPASEPRRSGRSQSLAELARASVAKKAAEGAADDLAKETLSLAVRSRPDVTEIAERVLKTSDPNGNVVPLESTKPKAPSTAPASRKSGAPARASRKAPLIAGIVALTGVAAAVAIVVARGPSATPQAESEPARATDTPAAAPAPAAPVAGQDQALSLDDLPKHAEPPAPVVAAPKPAEAPSAVAQAPRPAAKAAPVTQPKAAPLAEKTAAPAPAEPPEDPNGPPPGMQRAETVGSLPEKPSVGAVQAAIASVLGGARACVAGHAEASGAVLTFGSDGRVRTVTVSGPAAGTPSEGCVVAALKQARVEPFARPTFSVKTPPIRP